MAASSASKSAQPPSSASCRSTPTSSPVLAIGMVVDPPDRFDAAHRTPERQPGVEQLRIEQLGGEGCLEERREPRARRPARCRWHREQAHDASGDRQVGLGHQRVLAIVVVIDQAHRYPRPRRRSAHRGALEAMPLQAGQVASDQQRALRCSGSRREKRTSWFILSRLLLVARDHRRAAPMIAGYVAPVHWLAQALKRSSSSSPCSTQNSSSIARSAPGSPARSAPSSPVARAGAGRPGGWSARRECSRRSAPGHPGHWRRR